MDYNYSRDMSEESHNRKKRPYNGNDSRGRDAKRSNKNTKPTLKVLIPTFGAGKLIGKGGKNITELQNKYSASIDVAPSNEYFPGTECRPVNLSAEIEQIVELVIYIIDEVYDERDKNTDFTMAVTDFAMGYIMGRGGSVIKTIQDDSGASICIQKQSEAPSPGERTVTISGTADEKRAAALAMIDKMSAEPMRMSKPHSKPNSYSSRDDSYSARDDSYSSKYNSYPTKYSSSDPYQSQYDDRRDSFNLNSNLRDGETGSFNLNSNLRDGETGRFNLNSNLRDGETGRFNLNSNLRDGETGRFNLNSNLRDGETGRFNLNSNLRDGETGRFNLNSDLRDGETGRFNLNSNLRDEETGRFNFNSNLRDGETGRYTEIIQDEPAHGYGGDGLGHGSLGMGLSAAAATAVAALGGIDQAAAYEARCKAKTTFSVEMQIPNAMVGSIVGKSGALISDMSRSSGAQMSFSGKGEFVPGTQDRILTIKGSKKQVQKAHMLVDTKILEEEYTGI